MKLAELGPQLVDLTLDRDSIYAVTQTWRADSPGQRRAAVVWPFAGVPFTVSAPHASAPP